MLDDANDIKKLDKIVAASKANSHKWDHVFTTWTFEDRSAGHPETCIGCGGMSSCAASYALRTGLIIACSHQVHRRNVLMQSVRKFQSVSERAKPCIDSPVE
jgi:hypothetical protein